MIAVRILVTDVAMALDFYCGQLGFNIVERWGDAFAIHDREGVTLWLSGPGTSAQRPFENGVQPTPGGFNRLVITVDDLQASLAQISTTCVNGPIPGPGGQQVVLEDGVGNLVELFEPGKN